MPNPAGERLARLSRVAARRAAALTGRLGPDQHGPDPHGASDLAAVLYRAGAAEVLCVCCAVVEANSTQ